jgi:hypothetical protein
MPVTPAELTVIAALGASALTGGASRGVAALREHLRRNACDRDTLIAAVLLLEALQAGMADLLTAGAIASLTRLDRVRIRPLPLRPAVGS